MTERERFEAWARQRWTHHEDFDQRIKAPSKYNNYEVQAAWDAWQERAAQPAPSVPDGVAEALQRLIENGAVLGPASSEDALLMARYRQRLLACVPSVPNDVMAALDNLDDYVARIEGNDRGACAHINLLRQYLLDATEVGENK